MEQNDADDRRQENGQGSQDAQIGGSPEVSSRCLSLVLPLYPTKSSAEKFCYLRLEAQDKAQDRHDEEEGTGSFEPEEVQDVVVVVEGWDGGHENVQGCNDHEYESVEDENVNVEESGLPI